MMTRRLWAAALLATAIALPLAASAQQALVRPGAGAAPTAEAQKNFKVPHNAFGQPDLEGVWTNATVTPLERDAKFGTRAVMTPQELREREKEEADYIAEGDKPTDPNLKVTDLPVNCGRGFSGTNCGYNRGWTDPGETVMRVKGEPRTSFITSTPNGRMPARKTPAAAPGRGGGPGGGGSVNDNPETKTLAERCLTSFGNSAGPVMLPLLYNNNYRIAQSRDSVAIWVEMVHDVRMVDLNRKTHLPANIRPWWGDSLGHYEGNTLVVETTNYPRTNAFRGAWEDLKVTEKFTRVAANRVLYQFTVEAPSVWDTAWGGEYEFGNAKGDIYEYACHEGNYALEGMLAGARAEEATAAAKKTAAK
jgi:hypothetical protein